MYRSKKPLIFTVTLLLLVAVTVVGALALLVTQTNAIKNIFNPSHVTCVVDESFDGTNKTEIKIQNTGDIPAYIRVKLISYRVNENGDHIGGEASVPDFDLGSDWIADGGFYYYKKPVSPSASTGNLIGAGSLITLVEYTDTDGGKQVIEVMAEAIQADGKDSSGQKAVVAAWGVDPETLGSSGEVQG